MAIRELADYTLVYWKISQQWNGRSRGSTHTVGEAIGELGLIEKGHQQYRLPKLAAKLKEVIILGQEDDDLAHNIPATH